VEVFAFIIMPNHLHLIWRVKEPNGRESPQGSLFKYTAHVYRRMRRREGAERLTPYQVDAANKRHEFWQRDSLAIPLFTRKVALQKLNYLHNNPLADHWNLVKDPSDYAYSSAKYYERNEKNFLFLKDLMEEV
jgi:putative transposase